MNSFKTALAALGLALTTLVSGASADAYHHIDEVAHAIARQSGDLVHEVHHYRHTPEYRHLLNDSREMRALAEHMHEVAHLHGSLAHLEHDLRELDRTFHHLESVFDRAERSARCGRYGHIHGNTAHVRQLLNAIEDNIHHLQDDVRSLRRPRCHLDTPHSVGRPPYRVERPIYGGHHRPNPYTRGNAFSIGGGSTRITFRF